MMFRIIGVALLVVGAPVAMAVEVNAPADAVAEPRAEPASLFEGLDLPYEGYGAITLGYDGLLIVHVEAGPDPDEAPDTPFDWSLFVFHVVQENVQLAEIDGEWFLDKDGEMIRARGLTPSHVSLTDLPECNAQTCTGQAAMSVVGTVVLEYDPDSKFYRVFGTDSQSSALFETSFRAAQPPQARVPSLQPDVAATDAEQARARSCTSSTAKGCRCTSSGAAARCVRGRNGKTVSCSDNTGTTTCTDGAEGSCECTSVVGAMDVGL